MKLSMDRLRVLALIARTGSITAAAVELGVGASAVSQQISSLEQELGEPLLTRTTKPARLTRLGATLATHGENILEEFERAVITAESAATLVHGTFDIASIPTIALTVLNDVIQELRTTAPDLEIRVHDMEASRSLNALATHRIDLAVVDSFAGLPSPFPERTSVHPLGEEPVQVLASKELAEGIEGDSISLADFADHRWVLAPDNATCGAAAAHLCRLAGFEPKVRLETNDLLLLRTFVAGGFGVTALPRLALVDPPPNCVVLDIADPLAMRTIHAITRETTYNRPTEKLVLDALHGAARTRLEAPSSTTS